MTRVASLLAFGVLMASIARLHGDDDAAPPAIQKDGIRSAASLMPPQLSGGSIAPGSLISIRGWRFGQAKPLHAESHVERSLGGISLPIHQGDKLEYATPVFVSENEIQAVLPLDLSIGSADISVSRGADVSVAATVRIVPQSFGAFSANAKGWGQAILWNGLGTNDSALNSASWSAEPGQVVVLRGTGLGVANEPPMVIVAGSSSAHLRDVRQGKAGPGIDELVFELPTSTPEGCFVPILVRSSSGVTGNTVTASVKRGGGACQDPANWLHDRGEHVSRAGTLLLGRADIQLDLDAAKSTRFRFDMGYGNFRRGSDEAQSSALLLFPPAGSCTAYASSVKLRSLATPGAAFALLGGTPLDAGRTITIQGHSLSAALTRAMGFRKDYGGVLGGTAPLSSAQPKKLFFQPGTYEISGSGAADVGPFHARVPVPKAIQWTNRGSVAVVDRARGMELRWKSQRKNGLVLIIATNVEPNSGAGGTCACLASAEDGQFSIPPEALQNLPPTVPGSEGLPLNLLVVLELPNEPITTAGIQGLADLAVFFVSASARTVIYQ